jgi:hypothetical protein
MDMSRFARPGMSLTLTAILFLSQCVGCADPAGIQKVIVGGQVFVDGQPVPNGEIRFFPIEGTQGPVSGSPIKDGTYLAKYKDGVPVGKHRVEIMAYRSQKGSMPEEIAREGGATEQYLPEKYNANSELTCTVDSETENLDFDLTLNNS